MNYSKKILPLLLLLACISFSAKAQTEYKINYNDPYDIRPLKVNLLVLTLDGYGINAGIGAGAHAQYVIGKILTVEAIGKYSYLTINKKDLKSQNKIQKPLYLEGGAEFHFSDREVNRNLVLDLGTDGVTKTTMKIPIKARKIYAIRGGVFTLQSAVYGSDALPFITPNAVEYGDKYVTTSRTGGAYVGLSSRRIDKASIAVDGYGNRRRNRNRSLFIDVLFSGTKFDALQIAPNPDVDISATPTKNIGWRAGGQWMDNGTYTRVELGQLPTVASPFSFYLSFTFGITIYGNEKRKA